MNSSKWCLAEDISPQVSCGGRRLLSLSPEASYKLLKAGISYSIIEEFYDESRLLEDEESYFFSQLEWFGNFNKFLRNNIEYCKSRNIDLATNHFYRIKCFVDSVIIHFRIFSRFFETVKPENVLYIRKGAETGMPYNIYGPFNEQRHIVPLIVERICREKKIPLSVDAYQNDKTARGASQHKKQVKDILKKCNFKSPYYFFKYSKGLKPVRSAGKGNMNVLLLHAGCLPMDLLIKDLISLGHRVFLKTGDEISRISTIIQKKILDLKTGGYGKNELALKIKKDCRSASDAFSKKADLVKWISDKSGIDVSDIVDPYFKYFIENICYKSLVEADVIGNFYKKEKIDFVVSRSASEEGCVGSLLAAAKFKNRICFQHGCAAFSSKSQDMHELGLFDYYFAMHNEAESECRLTLDSKRDLLGDCKVFQAPYHMKEVNRRWSEARRDKNTIMYIPTKLFFGFRNYNAYLYPITWYFELQKSIIDLFSSRKDMKFIFKYAPGQGWSMDSIVSYLKDRKFANISVKSESVSQCIGKAGRVIVDFPSTSFYEAAAARIPVISVCPEWFKIRDSARKNFGRSIKQFKDIPGAIRIINDFLNNDPEAYSVNLAISNGNAVDTLKRIKNEYINVKSR